MTENVITIDALSVAYKMYAHPIDQIKELLSYRSYHETFWALRNISLKIEEGEKVGIVGRNGAGKSTLLKAIAGNLAPTKGSVRVNGRISSLLSMVPAWNLEETGLENIRYNLLLNGIPESDFPRLSEDIAEFTELGRFLSQPVKTYSTGMSARLSFGIATATQPDILIIDEVLGTGDGYFAWKAAQRMKEFCAKGRAMILVSHSTASIQSMCDRVIWLENGVVRADGSTNDVLHAFENDYRRAEDEMLRKAHINATANEIPAAGELPSVDQLRFRISASSGLNFSTTHFVYRIAVHFDGEPVFDLALENQDTSSATPRLDIENSEWGRIHERNDRLCRSLTRFAGRDKGGQFIVPFAENKSGRISVHTEFESGSSEENLQVEILDPASARWVRLEIDKEFIEYGSNIQQVTFSYLLSAIDRKSFLGLVQSLNEINKPVAEIGDVRILDGDTSINSVVEHQPFDVEVPITFNKSPEAADVSIKFTRVDGVHAFWQSSGLDGGNMINPLGNKVVIFHFNPNQLGAGEYYISIHVTNGWDYPMNFPHSEVFARKLNSNILRIRPRLEGVNFGVLNRSIRVTIKEPK